MAKKRTPKQRQQDNVEKKAGKSSSQPKWTKANVIKGDERDSTTQRPREKCNIPLQSDPVAAPPKGLTNLGNTCFFNSVMQSLCRSSQLLHVFTEASKLTEITLKDQNIRPLTCQLPSLPKLSQSFLNFLITMSDTTIFSNGHRSRTRVESPKLLFSQICLVSPRFRTYQQQDSQELLQCLLDGIKSEEIKRRKQAILTKFGVIRKRAEDVDDELKEKIKNYGRIASGIPTVVDIMFSGEIVSSVLCDECGRITQVHEEFLDIPLPIAETHSYHPNNVSKKSSKNKAKKEVESDSSSDTEQEMQGTSFKSTSSKHAKKKQREKERKGKHKRNRTKSRSAANPIGENEPNKELDVSEKNINESSLIPETNIQNHSQKTAETIDMLHASGDYHCYDGDGQTHLNISNGAALESTQKCSVNDNEGNVLQICDGIKKMSLTKSDLSSKNNEDAQSVEMIAKEIVTDILSMVACELDGELKNNGTTTVFADPSESTTSHTSFNDTDKTQLLGGKTVNTDSVDQFPLDKEINGATALQHNGTEHGAVDEKSPSSGNDEKSDSENSLPSVPSLFETPVKRPEVKFTGFCKKLPSSLSPRCELDKAECSILTCLHKFTMAEMLTGNNKFGCEECTKRTNVGVCKPKTVYCNASKQMLIEKPPLILTLQLKRFQQSGSNLRKLSKRVMIPESLNLSPFCSSVARKYATESGEIWYNLYGIVEHSGSMSRGHYTAYVHVRPENEYFKHFLGSSSARDSSLEEVPSVGQWYHISDTSVSKCTLDRALNSNAYLIFYERVR